VSVLPAGFAVLANFEGVGAATTMIFDDADSGRFNTGTFAGAAAFVDVAEYVRAGSITRGVSRFEGVYGRAEAGTAQVLLDNRDARFDPLNLAGPYVAAGASQVRPMRAWRIRAGGEDLWRGFADSWDLSYPLGASDATCLLRGTDGTKVLAGFDAPEQGSQGAGELSGDRIARVLDHAGWPAEDRVLDPGVTVLEATTLAQPAWSELVLTSDSEIGEIYFDGAGRFVFRDREAIMTDARSVTVQAEFADDGTGLPYVDLAVASDDEQLANQVRIDGPGITTEQVAEDTASQVVYQTRSFVRTDLLLRTDADALAYAEYVLYLLAEVELRFDTLTIDPRADPANLYPQVLGRELGDRIAITFTPPGGSAVRRECFIRGIAHVFDTAGWITTWALQDADGAGGDRLDFLILDDAARGLLDANRLAP
jgi:hypothetical protein